LAFALIALVATMAPHTALAEQDAAAQSQKRATPSGGGSAAGQNDEASELAKELQNPVAKLISVPLQSNWDFGIGSANAMRYTLNVQPVVPFSLNAEWNLIT
jgi:hypothetical protein